MWSSLGRRLAPIVLMLAATAASDPSGEVAEGWPVFEGER